MKITIAPSYADLLEAPEADQIIRACVHCGFCTATCPTYLELRDERDSPRGRIYLIKQLLEGAEVSVRTQQHLDRCLTCRACETTCPSGVKYGRLLDIARVITEEEIPRPPLEKYLRWGLRKVLPRARLFGTLLTFGQFFRPLLPARLKTKTPPRQRAGNWPESNHKRKMLVLEGCVQKSATPKTNAAAARVLERLGISLIAAPGATCCGAVSTHLGAPTEGLDYMRRNIDAWWPDIEKGTEAIVITASGCGVMVKEYAHHLRHDPDYAEKATRISQLTRDLSEVLHESDLTSLALKPGTEKIALHIPCTLQHGMQLPNTVQEILEKLGFAVVNTDEKHLCCGSAGTYSILQPVLSKRLLERKLTALETNNPELIATANIGCQMHLQSGTNTPVHHWIELLDRCLENH